jgi:Zn-dependent peptidase ImmA (M78 family)
VDIKGLVNSLCRKYHTRDPFEIAQQRRVIIQYEPLGSVHGFYSKSYRQQFIHINQDLDDRKQILTCCHELGHSVMHPDTNTPFLRAATFYSVDKFELQANRFALELRYSDDDLVELLHCSITDIAAYMGVPVSLAEYRIKNISIIQGGSI